MEIISTITYVRGDGPEMSDEELHAHFLREGFISPLNKIQLVEDIDGVKRYNVFNNDSED